MIRKVRYPLKYKFVLVITALLLLTMGFYLSYAVNIFKEDKAADVYSITLTNSISIAERIKLLMNEDINLLDGLKDNLSIEAIKSKMESIVSGHDSVLALECVLNNQSYVSQKNIKKLEFISGSDDLSAFDINESNGAYRFMQQVAVGENHLEMSLLNNFPANYSITRGIDKNLKCAIHLSYEKLMPLMIETIKYGASLLTNEGKVFLKLNDINQSKDLSNIVKNKAFANVQQGVTRFNSNGMTIIRAFSKVPSIGLIAITEIEERKAFLASSELIQKSLYFGILILSIAVIAGILFTRRITKNLQILFEANTLLSEGDFEVNPVVEGSDEIGALTDSFVEMKNKIIKFMGEMKEKARLESEMQVAHLVQDAFFPKSAISKDSFTIDGYYQPATECSGDWWGHFEQGPICTVIVCDATGHGVPAALITAAAHSCLSTLKIESEKVYISPKILLEKLNKVISSMNSEVLMTAFALEINEETKTITYSNASHMTPYLIRQINNDYNKEGVIPLQENNGARIGEKSSSEYFDSKIEVFPGDRVILYSDGMTEMIVDSKPWGQRNFFKSLFKACQFEASELIRQVIADFKDFSQNAILQDDITLVAISFNDKNVVIENMEQFREIQSELENESFLISKLSNEENITKLLEESKINHLIGHNTIDLEREIRLVKKLEKSDSFNLNDYLHENYKTKTSTLVSNKKISEVVDVVVSNFREDFSGGINLDVLKLVSEELLSNAFYHSGGSQHSFARGQEIILSPGKIVEYSFAVSEEYVVVSVKGPSAFTSREKVISSIQRGYREKTPVLGESGAGLGLYMIYENCNQFWIIKGKTNLGQIICVFEKFNRYKKAKERITSFHFLEKELGT